MAGQTQISAYISTTTKEKLERYAEAHGMKKAALIEQALLHHLQALSELPSDVIIPPEIVVSRKTFNRITSLVKKPGKPTRAMRALMAGKQLDELDG